MANDVGDSDSIGGDYSDADAAAGKRSEYSGGNVVAVSYIGIYDGDSRVGSAVGGTSESVVSSEYVYGGSSSVSGVGEGDTSSVAVVGGS